MLDSAELAQTSPSDRAAAAVASAVTQHLGALDLTEATAEDPPTGFAAAPAKSQPPPPAPSALPELPEEEEIELAAADGEVRIFQVWPMQPRTHDLEVIWRIVDLGIQHPTAPTGRTAVPAREGDIFRRTSTAVSPEGRTIYGAQFRAKDHRPGWYRLRVEVRDPTQWVLEDSEGLLVDRRAWLVRVR